MALPDSLSYHVVFDVSRQLPQWWWSFLIPLAIVFVLMRFGARNRMNQHRWFKRIFVGFAVVFAIVDVMFTWTQYAGQRNALEHGDVRVDPAARVGLPARRAGLPALQRPEHFLDRHHAGDVRAVRA